MQTKPNNTIVKAVEICYVNSIGSGITTEMWESEITKKTFQQLVGKTLPGDFVFMHQAGVMPAVLLQKKWLNINSGQNLISITITDVSLDGVVLGDVKFRSNDLYGEFVKGSLKFFPRMTVTIDGRHVTSIIAIDFASVST